VADINVLKRIEIFMHLQSNRKEIDEKLYILLKFIKQIVLEKNITLEYNYSSSSDDKDYELILGNLKNTLRSRYFVRCRYLLAQFYRFSI
jgi:hypothetical protein